MNEFKMVYEDCQNQACGVYCEDYNLNCAAPMHPVSCGKYSNVRMVGCTYEIMNSLLELLALMELKKIVKEEL